MPLQPFGGLDKLGPTLGATAVSSSWPCALRRPLTTILALCIEEEIDPRCGYRRC